MNKYKTTITVAVVLAFLLPGSAVFANNESGSTSWSVTLNFNEPGGKMDYVVFGEASDANDGVPVDSHDVLKPPLPHEPYLRAWFDDDLPAPYNLLWKDYRKYPDIDKVWDLYVRWKSSDSTPIGINISWDISEFANCEYNSVVLWRYDPFDVEWDFVADMLTEDSYVYTPVWFNEQWLIDHFQINTTGGFENNPPYEPSSPSPSDGATGVFIDAGLSWTGGDPNGDPVAYDVYFGTSSPPSKVVSNQSGTSYNPGGGELEYITQYYWQIVAWDDYDASNESPIWSFTTGSSGGNGGNGGNGNGGDEENKPPVADAGGPYQGVTNQTITFDGSGSTDQDGYIVNYTWDFGDNTTGYSIKPIHSYNTSGLYDITLTVKDDDGLTNISSTTTANITLDSDGDGYSDEMEDSYGTNATDPNEFPLDTDKDGIPDEDSEDGNYTGDPDDDNDGLNDEIEEELGSDPKNESDVKSIDGIEGGYLVDTNGTGQYDTFYNATSGVTTNVTTDEDGKYLIDSDGDDTWDWIYDLDTLTEYSQQEEQNTPSFELILVVCAIAVFLLWKRKNIK